MIKIIVGLIGGGFIMGAILVVTVSIAQGIVKQLKK